MATATRAPGSTARWAVPCGAASRDRPVPRASCRPVMKPLRFAARVRLAFLAALVAVAGAGALAAVWFPSPWIVLLAAAALGLPVGWWILDRILGPATRVLQAL